MAHEPLWAPWRMTFIASAKDRPESGCVFCELLKETEDRKNLILFRGELNFVILNKYPYNNGHLMVVPKQHTADFQGLSKEVLVESQLLLQRSMKALHKVYAPQGYNSGMNLGAAAGAGIKDHLHWHLVPRWIGDTNFMPAIGSTKVMPQHLDNTYEQLVSNF